MNKGLDLIQRQQIETIEGYPTGNVYIGLTFEELAELEKELKALEIIKEKKVDIIELFICFKNFDLKEYNNHISYFYSIRPLTQEEYDLLKEMLL